jgi:Tfp pilus assembly protein PilF
VIEFPRDPDSEARKQQAQRVASAQGAAGGADQGEEPSGSEEAGWAQLPQTKHAPPPLLRRAAPEFERVHTGHRYRLVGIMAVLIIVAGFWYVAFNAFREIKDVVNAPGEPAKTVQQAQTEPQAVPGSPRPEGVRPETPPSTQTAATPATPSSQPSVEQLVSEAKHVWPSDPAAAQKILEEAVALKPDHFEASFQLARLFAYRMNYGAAIRQYEKTLQINKQNPEVYFNLGHIYLTQGNYDAAVQNLEACWALKPPFQDEVLANLGIAYLKKDRPDRAKDLFRQALEINPANQVAKGYLAASLKLDADSAAGGAGEAGPKSTEAKEADAVVSQLVVEAKELLESDPVGAKRLLDEAIALDPNDFGAVFQLGRLLTFQKDYPAAVDQYQKALLLNSQAPDVHFNLGYIHLVSKDYDKAIQYYESCLALSPPYRDEVLTNLGLSHLKKGNAAQARKLFEEALDVNANNEVARGYLRNMDKSRQGRSDANPAGAPDDLPALQPRVAAAAGKPAEPPQPGQRPLEGDYLVEGVNPSGSTYKGKASLRRQGDAYMVTWTISNEKFSGSGSLSGEVLAVNWKTAAGVSGVVQYEIGHDGILKGSWADGAGAETLIPVRR